jgi:N-methylhydantoinase B
MTAAVAGPVTVDPVTFEVIRHRLLGIVDEQAARLSAISGSKNVTEMSDFNVGLYLPDGSVATMGRTILFHAASMAAMVRHVIEDCAENPGIGPGDMFVVNNPWKGAVHGPDMAIVAPVFAGDRLIFWSGGLMHMPDIGGLREGGMGLDATECYQEGLLLPPVKLVRGGVLQADIWNLILSHSRAAPAMTLDLKGLMAANHAAAEGLGKLVDRYGVATLEAVMSGLVHISEDRMRRRLRELPDATVDATGYFEVNHATGDYPQVTLELTKQDDRLILDYSKSAPQVADSSNCTWGGLMAGISAALLPTICYDIPWNAGLYRPLEVICPEGRVCNAARPAAVSGNISGAVWEVQLATIAAISRLLACSDTYLSEAESSPASRPGAFTYFGVNQHGERFFGFRYEVLASGGSAYHDHDGVSTQGHHDIERLNISNIEALELDQPMLYLSRRLACDSGGAGRHRGGLSIESLYRPHKATAFMARFPERLDVPDAPGIFGGYPASEDNLLLLRESSVGQVLAAGRVAGLADVTGTPAPMTDVAAVVHLLPDDVIWVSSPGGSGWGDPLDRPAEAVQADLESGAVSAAAAGRVYGVVIGEDGRADAAATLALREELREERRRWPTRGAAGPGPAGRCDRTGPLGDRLELARDEQGAQWIRCSCGHVLGPASGRWREHAGRSVAEPADIAPSFRIPAGMEVRRYACPGCGRLHAVELCHAAAPDSQDVRLVLPA